MGDEDHPAIVTVPRVGYRLGVPVHCKTVAAAAGPELGFNAGDTVPGPEQGRLSRPTEILGWREVWPAANPKTKEKRAFKIAGATAQLTAFNGRMQQSRLFP